MHNQSKPQPYQLHTQNKDALIFNTEEIGYTVLGGINTNHLDRMRVTLKTRSRGYVALYLCKPSR